MRFVCIDFLKEKAELALKTLEKDGFTVLIGEDKHFLIISPDKSREQVDSAIFSLLKKGFIGYRHENSFKNF